MSDHRQREQSSRPACSSSLRGSRSSEDMAARGTRYAIAKVPLKASSSSVRLNGKKPNRAQNGSAVADWESEGGSVSAPYGGGRELESECKLLPSTAQVCSPEQPKRRAEISAWKETVGRFQTANFWRASWQIVKTVGSYALLGYLMYLSLSVSWWIIVPLALLAGGPRLWTLVMRLSRWSLKRDRASRHPEKGPRDHHDGKPAHQIEALEGATQHKEQRCLQEP
jgi:hypothetical protein